MNLFLKDSSTQKRKLRLKCSKWISETSKKFQLYNVQPPLFISNRFWQTPTRCSQNQSENNRNESRHSQLETIIRNCFRISNVLALVVERGSLTSSTSAHTKRLATLNNYMWALWEALPDEGAAKISYFVWAEVVELRLQNLRTV